MGSSASFFRFTLDNFKIIQQAPDGTKVDYLKLAESDATCTGSHWGLEFILSSGQDNKTVEIIGEIFNPKQAIGEQEFNASAPDIKWEMYEKGDYIPYLDSPIISKITNLLDNISESDIRGKYNSNELNDNDIYPKVWHNDNSSDHSFNERHILEDFLQLKEIFKTADKENNFILVLIG